MRIQARHISTPMRARFKPKIRNEPSERQASFSRSNPDLPQFSNLKFEISDPIFQFPNLKFEISSYSHGDLLPIFSLPPASSLPCHLPLTFCLPPQIIYPVRCGS